MYKGNDPAEELPFEIKFELSQWEKYPLAFYHKESQNIEEALQSTIDQLSRLLPSIKKSSKLLVLGSGNTLIARYLLHKYSCSVELLVSSEEAKALAEEELKSVEDTEKLSISVQNFESIILDREFYDIVFSIGEIYNIDDTLKVFKSIARSLTPEGRFIMLELFDSFNEDIELEGYENITTIDNYLRRARRSDLERVFAKDYPDKTILHYNSLQDMIEESDAPSKEVMRVKKLAKYANNKSIHWGIIQLQKRNN